MAYGTVCKLGKYLKEASGESISASISVALREEGKEGYNFSGQIKVDLRLIFRKNHILIILARYCTDC